MRRPLGNMEVAQATTNEHYPFNAVIILRIANSPSEKTVRELLKYLQQRHPLLAVHVQKEKNRYLFVSEGTPEIPLTVIQRQGSDHWQQVAEEELNREFDLFTGPLVRLAYLTDSGKKKESEIVLTFQHTILDAVSAANLFHEILSFCGEVEAGGTPKESEPFATLPAAQDLFPPSFKGLRRKAHLFAFALRQMGDEFRFRMGGRGKRKPPVHPAGKCKILPMRLSKEITAALSKGARKKRITLTNVLSAAMMMAVQKHLYHGQALPLRHIHTADLRPYLVPPLGPDYFGSYFSMMRFTLAMEENPQIWQLAHKINDITYTSLKKGDKFCAHLMSAQMMRMLFRFKSFRMAATAASNTGPVMLEKSYGKISLQGIHAFVSNFVVGPEYTAMVRLFDEQIYWDILYLDSDMDAKEARVIGDEIFTILESAAKEAAQ